MRHHSNRAYKTLGIRYLVGSQPPPLRTPIPLDLYVSTVFPNGRSILIHLTDERGYEDLDGRAHLAKYRQFIREFERRFSGRPKELVVLDCACGSGYGSHEISMRTRSLVVGVDINSKAVRYASMRYPSEKITFVNGSGSALTMLQSSSVSAVVTIETLEHLYDAGQFLKEIRRILKPDGFLFLTTPDARYNQGQLHSRYHINEYDLRQLVKMVSSWGFNCRAQSDGDQITLYAEPANDTIPHQPL